MKRYQRRQESACLNLSGWLLVVWLILGVAYMGGCRKSDAPTGSGSGADDEFDVESLLSGGPGVPQPPQVPAVPPEEVLKAMVTAYKTAAGYQDQGFIRVAAPGGAQPQEMRGNCLVVMTRPNKLRLQVDQGVFVCDGSQLWAYTGFLRGQVMRRPAPEVITPEAVLADPIFSMAISEIPTNSFSWLPVQIVLLLADDPLKTLLYQSTEIALLNDAPIDGRPCHRVQTISPRGRSVFWIDARTNVLRRFEFPTAQLEAATGQRGLTLVGEYQNAEFSSQVDPRAFMFEAPPDAKMVETFIPPGHDFLGKPVGELDFSDSEGKPVAADFLSGKVGVLDIWETTCVPCRQTMPETAKAYAKYKDNPKVAFMAVSVDEATVENGTLLEVLGDWGVELPVFRDLKKSAFERFDLPGIPTTIIVGPKGLIQEYGQPLSADQLSGRIDALLAGKDLYTQILDDAEQGVQEFLWIRKRCIDTDLYVIDEQSINAVDILPRTEPESLRIGKLWSCAELTAENTIPGNILVVEEDEAPPRILVLKTEFGPQIRTSVVEIGIDGKVVSTHPLETDANEPVMYLRTGVGADGRRYYAASAMGSSHVYLLDEEFKTLLKYPDDATSSQHAGIGDVRLVDLDADGKLEMAVGYFDVGGMQCVSLEGKRIWAERSLMNVLRIAPLAPDAQRRRSLLCTNIQPDKGPLAVVDPEGKRQAEVAVPGHRLIWVSAADLDGDGRQDLCGLARSTARSVTAVGFTMSGEELWSHPMPRGVHQQPIESVTSGKLLPQEPGQWIMASPDGTIHIISSGGKLVDSFAYGAALTGLATATWDGKRVLLVDTTEGLDACQIELPPAP